VGVFTLLDAVRADSHAHHCHMHPTNYFALATDPFNSHTKIYQSSQQQRFNKLDPVPKLCLDTFLVLQHGLLP
jgi:hypothetical protein